MTQKPLEYGEIYHIYNRDNNGEIIFIEERNYAYFMQLYEKYISPFADTFAYCLMPNHFHFLIRIKTDLPGFGNLEGLDAESLKPDRESQELRSSEERSSYQRLGQQFATFFGTYTKAFNKCLRQFGLENRIA